MLFSKLPVLAPCSKEGSVTLPNRSRITYLHQILLSTEIESPMPVTLYARAQLIYDYLSTCNYALRGSRP